MGGGGRARGIGKVAGPPCRSGKQAPKGACPGQKHVTHGSHYAQGNTPGGYKAIFITLCPAPAGAAARQGAGAPHREPSQNPSQKPRPLHPSGRPAYCHPRALAGASCYLRYAWSYLRRPRRPPSPPRLRAFLGVLGSPKFPLPSSVSASFHRPWPGFAPRGRKPGAGVLAGEKLAPPPPFSVQPTQRVGGRSSPHLAARGERGRLRVVVPFKEQNQTRALRAPVGPSAPSF